MTIILNTLDEVTSTNDVAMRGLSRGDPQGTVYRARRQTAGRGRHGRPWLSEPGNLYMSLVLQPKLAPDQFPTLTLAAAVGARETLDGFGVACGLKWPNDLMIGERKLGGILAEGLFEGGRLKGCLVGVGINVSLGVDRLDEPLRSSATSFRHLGVPEPDLDALATAIGSAVVNQAQLVEVGQLDRVLSAWRAVSVTLGRRVEYERQGSLRLGTALDLDERGALIIDEDGTGRVHVDTGVVRLWHQQRLEP